MERFRNPAVAILIVAVVGLGVLVLQLAKSVDRLSMRNEQLTVVVRKSMTRLMTQAARLRAEQDEMKQLLTLEPAKARSTFDFIVATKARLATLGRHEATMRALRSIGTALGSYQVDYSFYPMSLDHLEPDYILSAPTKDGWSHPLQYSVRGDRPRTYTLTGPGQDGAVGTGDDYVYVDGQVERSPDVKRLSVDSLDLPGDAPTSAN